MCSEVSGAYSGKPQLTHRRAKPLWYHHFAKNHLPHLGHLKLVHLRLATIHPSAEIHKPLGVPMTRHMIWAEDENFTGWCCSRCPWGVVAPRLESTVAALAFNRVAQEGFEQHACAQNTRETAPL